MSEHTKGRLVPKFAGEFTSYQQWVNKGTTWLKSPDHRRAMCIDALGRRVAIGADFMRARDEDAFPVRFFWECELTNDTAESELAAARALLRDVLQDIDEEDVALKLATYSRVISYLDACDTLEGAPNAG